MFQPLNLGLKFITNLFLSWWRPNINPLLFQLLILTMGLMVKHIRIRWLASNQNLKAKMDFYCSGLMLDKLCTSSISCTESWWWFDFINYLQWLSEPPTSLQFHFIDEFLVLSISFHKTNTFILAIISISSCLVLSRRFSIAYQDNWNTFIIWPGMLIS